MSSESSAATSAIEMRVMDRPPKPLQDRSRTHFVCQELFAGRVRQGADVRGAVRPIPADGQGTACAERVGARRNDGGGWTRLTEGATPAIGRVDEGRCSGTQETRTVA